MPIEDRLGDAECLPLVAGWGPWGCEVAQQWISYLKYQLIYLQLVGKIFLHAGSKKKRIRLNKKNDRHMT